MRRALANLAVVLVCLGALGAQKPVALGRSVHGYVLDAAEKAVPGAIVYLKNLRTKAIRSYIADEKGVYVFHSLEPNVDYELQAEHNGLRGPARTDSAYNNAADQQLDLKVP